MGKRLSSRLYQPAPGTLLFWCPGCQTLHGFSVKPQHSWGWEWDGSVDAPTITPSILTHLDAKTRCHCFIRRGKIEFLPDCWHSLSGQTVAMAELPAWLGADEE